MIYWSVIEVKLQECIKITHENIIHRTVIHIVGHDLLEDTIRRFQIKEYEILAKTILEGSYSIF